MFVVKAVTTFEGYCAKGHPSLPLQRFCRICGGSIKERQVSCDAAYCSNCNSRVVPTWNYCPYCGQGR